MGITRENRNTRRENCPSATLSITDLTGTVIRSNKGVSNERTMSNHLGYRTALKLEVHFNEI
jgi:hypothetical protein